jgi:hypothetical protein
MNHSMSTYDQIVGALSDAITVTVLVNDVDSGIQRNLKAGNGITPSIKN